MTVKTIKRWVSLVSSASLLVLVVPFWTAGSGLANVSVLAPNTIADIAQAASPAVVNIEVDQPINAPSFPLFQLPFGDMPNSPNFEFFFNGQRVQPPNLNRPGTPEPKLKRHNMGSGFIIREDGYILTNAHVVNQASEIRVTLSEKIPLEKHVFENARVVGSDIYSDLAVLKIDAKDLPTLKLGKSADLRPGEFTVAIGNPVGLDHTVTFGIISAVARDVQNVNDNINFIQTDAAINPGNSGGPLLNLDGEVIGVNTAIQANAQSIGFSIPIDVAKEVADAFIAGRPIVSPYLVRPYLGIKMQDVDEALSKSLGLPTTTRGVLVAAVFANSPALAAGLERGDIIQKIDGKEIRTGKEIQDLVHAHKVKDTLKFFLLRNKVGLAVSVNIGIRPNSVPRQLNRQVE
jgi:S1-C subfamily serine protease